ncbi:NYN domain-containing protein [Aquibacillus sp. 3ASR75-11]|uniref:NYN domain-containing protein n=1 Tax=Terrihalobacillus insolitus TaxID=2950438 RepID=A0A9X4APF9_9BACI|nr:NYN domain-containing protein [Terrihalobacillus insolitus]MDC3414660.1 NYN domain-containing protein [Terrihalobacillus insolitus]MDC3425500.1 NYN domain-containing protein [Terrihalobacillus insolitus]
MVVLLVDGYNMIGAWEELQRLKDQDLGQARDLLINQLAEYQAFTGDRVIIVFDAYYVRGLEKKQKDHRVEVIYTKENETADECIEKLVKQVKNVKTKVYVATSDYAEQRTIFAQGALRKSARELYIETKNIEKEIEKEVTFHKHNQSSSRIPMNKEMRDLFEKWRRGNK